ncbi:MAG: FAD-dependent oxidoreductase [Pyrinomonadaceae bacterium]
MPRVAIIGAGLAGSLLAIYLAKRGLEVDVYEARGDMRQEDVAGGRSINLALSDRGIAALREVGMDEYMLAEAVPMYGRMIHSTSGDTKLLPYSGRKGEYINSISRGGLNIALMNEAEKHPGVRVHFSKQSSDFDTKSGTVRFADRTEVMADTVIATDGAGSIIRQAMERQLAGFSVSSVFLEHGYKELQIPALKQWPSNVQPPAAEGGSDSDFLLEKNALHIWPRHQFMMIALPNWDGSFTCTLFLDRAAFDELTNEAAVRGFFEREFPDAVPLMPTLVDDFFDNPTGQLGTVKCWPWNVGGKVLLLGDSAHAVVPFYGQGMNCAFEDVRVLASLIDRHGTNWELLYEEYGRARKVNTDAIADMAEENFYEMRDRVADPIFQRKRELETRLEQTYPDYFSKYSMVTFRDDMPYSEAMRRGNAQDAFLMEYCRNLADVSAVELDDVQQKLKEVIE